MLKDVCRLDLLLLAFILEAGTVYKAVASQEKHRRAPRSPISYTLVIIPVAGAVQQFFIGEIEDPASNPAHDLCIASVSKQDTMPS